MVKIERYDNLTIVDLNDYISHYKKSVLDLKSGDKFKSFNLNSWAFIRPLSFKRNKNYSFIYPRYFDFPKYIQMVIERYKDYPQLYEVLYNDIRKGQIKFYDKRSNITQYDPIEYDFDGLDFLREAQKEIISQMAEIYPSVVKLNTGFGKTVIALSFVFSIYDKKALFIVDQKNIGDQFINKFNQFIKPIDPSLEVNDLRKYSSKTIIKILQNRKIDSIYNLITVQKLINILKSYDIFQLSKLFNEFGIVIYDESHTTSASYAYGLTSMMFNTQYIYGLTATPYFTKKDFVKQLYFEGIFSKNIIQLEEDKKEKALSESIEKLTKVRIVFIEDEEEGIYKKHKWLILKQKEEDRFMFYRNYYISKFIQKASKKFLSVLTSIIKHYYNNNQKIIITAKAKSDIDLIYSSLKNIYDDIALYTGKDKKGDIYSASIIVSTYDMVKKGFDLPDIEIIINLYPIRSKSGIIQLIGRALRKSHKKKSPEYIEIVPKSILNIGNKKYFIKNLVDTIKMEYPYFDIKNDFLTFNLK